jgi:hypothetical protein
LRSVGGTHRSFFAGCDAEMRVADDEGLAAVCLMARRVWRMRRKHGVCWERRVRRVALGLVHGVALTHKRCFFSVLTLGVHKRPCFFLLKPLSTHHPCVAYGIPSPMNALFGQSLLCDLLSRTSTLNRSPLPSSSPRPHLLVAYGLPGTYPAPAPATDAGLSTEERPRSRSCTCSLSRYPAFLLIAAQPAPYICMPHSSWPDPSPHIEM